ncbi:MAG: sigma-70 family RNA polymerase sigma factor [Clostridia bacterium]|nr:sigma-70 family RNA polymerase sigma factor [Clostridia bacterium]
MAEILEQVTRRSHEIRDERLLGYALAARGGSEKAFEEIVKICEKGVYELSYQISRNRDDALDISQETFCKLWLFLSGDDDIGQIKAWYSYILRMARNCALDFLRRQSIRRHDSLSVADEDGETKDIEIADDDVSSDPVLSYERSEKIKAVRDAIDSLEDDYRRVLVLREREGCSYKEISDILGIEMGTVKSKIFRARNLVKEYLEKRNIF